ncbi:hypothetical protein Poly51_06310 [Rubripirellula tenax]|uniref:Uncharacterized protein n=1 Tax=Rubripirellula tenax TaxID=2528015 RepID=A0A5C6FEX1_9BACT|nr:hypothetical protein Poly51_06310 [Rubripirellula tenax]
MKGIEHRPLANVPNLPWRDKSRVDASLNQMSSKCLRILVVA